MPFVFATSVYEQKMAPPSFPVSRNPIPSI
jgi:hypothetical protein